MDHIKSVCYNGPDCPLCREATQQRKEDLERLVEAVGQVLWTYEELKDAGYCLAEKAHLQRQFAVDMETLYKRHQQVA